VVAVQAALDAGLGRTLELPALSLPFVLVAWGLVLVAASVPGLVPVAAGAPSSPPAWLPELVGGWLTALASVLFVPGPAPGALVALAIVLETRIGLSLSVLGFAVGHAALQAFSGSARPPVGLEENALLAAMSLGGAWLVPQRSAFALAVLGAGGAALGTVALSALTALPALIGPFNVVTLGMVLALRQRVGGAAPRLVDFVPGTPEANLAYHRTRVARFGTRWLRLALPFLGRWTVTQGVDGGITHVGPWRHALDFEVQGADGRVFSAAGARLEDFHCYRLPVLAVAAGRVVKVVHEVPDNPVGEHNPDDNWGNLVMLEHGPGLYSLVCHLAPGTVEVVEGQRVGQGARLGRCGNSGRSFVPHLHLQLQASPRLGAATLELELNELVDESGAGPVLFRSCVPTRGARVRNLDPRDELAALFTLPVGARLDFALDGPRGPSRERVEVSVDLWGALVLESERGHRLHVERTPRQFIAHDCLGSRHSALFLWAAAAPRVPLELPAGLVWDDVVPRRAFRPRWRAWATDLLEPFLGEGPLRLDFTSSLEADALTVRGHGQLGRERLETWARFTASGAMEFRLEHAGAVSTARLEGRPHALVTAPARLARARAA
jgi:murein DD-endopeptidase MepM/ murein hydrolase activator NlpD